MKRFLFSATLFLCSLLTFGQYSGSGSGTESDPYLIFNENQLSQVANFLNQEGIVFKLMKDLDLSNWIAENNPSQGWLPLGVESSPFKGKFLGNNHKIGGISINRASTNHAGFFGYVSGATISDLTIEGTSIVGAQNVGGIAGYITGSTVSNCHVVLNETDGISGTYYIGGIAGYSTNTNYSTFSVASSVNSATGGFAGGCVGYVVGGTFSDGTITSAITNTGDYTGSYFGWAESFTLTNADAKCDITSRDYTGGITGYSEGGNLTNCVYEGTLSGRQYVGGTAGALIDASSSFKSCFSKGKITASGDYCGGIIGVSHGGQIGSMADCSHFGDICGQSYIGGLIGAINNTAAPPVLHTYTDRSSSSINKTIKETIINGSNVTKGVNNCTAIGNITGNSYVGGLIGKETTANSYSYTTKSTGVARNYWYDENWNNLGTSSRPYEYARNTISLSLTNSYYSGKIEGKDNVGGLYGYKSGGSILNNYAYANIYGSTNVGGIVGCISADQIENSFNTTTVKSNVANNTTISATSSNIGRIYGKADANYTIVGALGSAEGNRAFTQTHVILSGVVQEIIDDLQNGTSTGTSLLRLKATYVAMGWDFDTNWNIQETECYPYKKYQAAPPVIESDLVSQATSISGNSIDGGTVYLFYKNRDAISTQSVNNQWTFDTEALQSGAQIQIYADVEGMTPSYFTSTTVGYPGSGTEDDPWRIYTAEDLQGASNRGYYKVMNDIDLTEWINENSPSTGWPAIGRNSGEATYIDGDGHKITGLWINTTENYNGLFSNFSAGQIKNLNVEVASGKKVKGGDYTGILIGRNANGSIVNCSVIGEVEGTIHVGGVVGYVESTTMKSVTFDGKVNSTSANAFIGGVAGQIAGCTVDNCRSSVTINTSGADNRIGGLGGYSKGGTINKSIANTTILSTGANNYVGGLIGYSETPATLTVSKGSVSATGANSYVGGLIGYALSPVSDSYSTASTTGTQFTAGLVGYTFSTIDKCYAKGNVYGDMYGAGVVGELDGANAQLTNSVACNNILSLTAQSSWGSRVIGGFKNGASDPDLSNYALNTMQVSLNNVPQVKTDDLVEGIAKTEAELMSSETYLDMGWNLSETWGIDEGEIYPYLLWEIDINPVADVKFDKTTMLIAVGKTETITASVLPLGATNKRLEWNTSNAAIATVDNGVVTAVGVGSATITATSTDGSNISTICKVTVTANKDAAIAELQAIVDHAQELYDNSTEGENIGQYASGSRKALLTTINNVKANISSTMDDATISQCTDEINAAIELFESKKVTAGEDTDYSTIDNVIYLEKAEAAAGGQLKLSVKMKNTVAVQGYQFDLHLPDGVSIATDADGFAMAELSTARTSTRKTDYFNTSISSEGTLRVLCGSSGGYTFEGEDGEVAIITLNIDADIAEGEHPLILKEVKLSDNNSQAYSTSYVKSTLVISSYTLGDVNADGNIDVADFISIANYILGNTAAGFVEKAADVNIDSSIDVADFIGVANMILNQSSEARQRTPMIAMNQTEQRVFTTDVNALDNAIYIEPITIAPGTQQVLSVKMKNASDVAGYEFKLHLPDGITVATDLDDMIMAELSTERTTTKRTDYFNSSLQSDGTLKVLCGSSTKNPNTGLLYTFEGNDGEVARITISVPEGYELGDHSIHIKSAIIADANGAKTELEDVETILTVGENVIIIDEASTELPKATETASNIKVKRTIKANSWSTICLPFAMTAAQTYEAFGEDVQLVEFLEYEASDDLSAISVIFESAYLDEDGFMANYPYLIKTSKDITEFTTNSIIEPDEENAIAEFTNGRTGSRKEVYGTFYGTLKSGTTVPENSLYVSGNKFWYSTGKTPISGLRGYFEFVDLLNGFGDSSANLRIVVKDNATGIESLIEKRPTGEWYTLQGIRISKPTSKGIYIRDGKKVYIK